jgi:nitrite reductase/ring-hydroxylating ferredoxin subunit
VNASIERVWENVHDWEHLPWLHSGSFSSIDLRESGSWGWRAKIGLQPPQAGEILLELVLTDSGDRYVSRTLEGPGVGTEIWTRLAEDGVDRTRIEVEFHVPGVPAASAESTGAAFVALYTRLWDEDESMMVERTAQLRGRGVAKGSRDLEAIRDLGSFESLRKRLPLVVEYGGRRFRIVAVGEEIEVHACVCPHRMGPLDAVPVEDGRIRCPWHGFEFDVRTGRSSDGRGLRLPRAPRVEVDSETGRAQLRG